MATISDPTRLRLPYATGMPPTNDRAQTWSEAGDLILKDPHDLDELRVIAAAAFRIGVCASHQIGAWRDEKRADDDELLTPAEVAQEFKCKPWSVREAIRRKKLVVWKPHEGAVRGCRIARRIARLWASGKVIALLSWIPWEVV